MKRNKIALLSACLLLGALAGCGGQGRDCFGSRGDGGRDGGFL